MTRTRMGLLALLLLLSMSCNLISPARTIPGTQQLPDVFPQGTPIPETGVAVLTPSSPTVEGTAIPAPVTLQPVAGGDCLPEKGHAPLPEMTFEQYPQAILEFLNEGGAPENLAQALEAAGVGNLPHSVDYADMTGDGKNEVVASILDPQSTGILPAGILLIYACQQDQYALLYREATRDMEGGPYIWFLQDLNGDGKADLVSSQTTCGAHACFDRVQILVWNREAFENRLEGDSGDLSNPVIEVDDPKSDGLYDLLVTSTGAGSVGAGPARSLTRVWSFQPDKGVWQPQGEFLGASDFRIHLLHDADTEAKAGQYDLASQLYSRVIEDDTLQDWVDPGMERANLSAYAHFKLMVIGHLQGEDQLAQQQLSDLEATFPAGTPQHAFVEMAIVFEKAFAAGGLESGCPAAQEYAAQHEDQILTVLDFGYGNPTYTPEDICP